MTQLTGIVGQAGQIVAAYPLVAGLHGSGWTPTFATAAGIGLVAAATVAIGLRNVPPVFWAVGLVAVLVTRRQARRRRNIVLDAFPRAVARRLAAARS